MDQDETTYAGQPLSERQQREIDFNQNGAVRRPRVHFNRDGSQYIECDNPEQEALEFTADANANGVPSLGKYRPMVYAAAVAWSASYDGTNRDELMDGCLGELCFEGMERMFGDGVTPAQARGQVEHMVETVWGRTAIGDPEGKKLGISDILASVDKAYLMRQNGAGNIVAFISKEGKVSDRKGLKASRDLRDYFMGGNLAPGMEGAGMAWLVANEPEDYADLQAGKTTLAKLYDEHYEAFAKASAGELREMAEQYGETWKMVARYEILHRLAERAAMHPDRELDYNEQNRIVNSVLRGEDGGDASHPYDDRFTVGRWMNTAAVQEAQTRYRAGIRARRDEAGEMRRKGELDAFKGANRVEKGKKEEAPAKGKVLDKTALFVGRWGFSSAVDGGQPSGLPRAEISQGAWEKKKAELGWKPGDKIWARIRRGNSYVKVEVTGTYETEDGQDHGVLLNAAAARQMLPKRHQSLEEGMTDTADTAFFIERKQND